MFRGVTQPCLTYPSARRPPGFPPTGGPALRPTWGLAIALTVLFSLVIATDVLALVADLNMRAVLDSLATTTEKQADRATCCTEWPPSSRAPS